MHLSTFPGKAKDSSLGDGALERLSFRIVTAIKSSHGLCLAVDDLVGFQGISPRFPGNFAEVIQRVFVVARAGMDLADGIAAPIADQNRFIVHRSGLLAGVVLRD